MYDSGFLLEIIRSIYSIVKKTVIIHSETKMKLWYFESSFSTDSSITNKTLSKITPRRNKSKILPPTVFEP